MNYDMLALLSEFYRCPNNDRILVSPSKGDDKVLCGCGKTQPAGITGGPHHTTFEEPPGVHIKKYLPRATVQDYIRQEEGA